MIDEIKDMIDEMIGSMGLEEALASTLEIAEYCNMNADALEADIQWMEEEDVGLEPEVEVSKEDDGEEE